MVASGSFHVPVVNPHIWANLFPVWHGYISKAKQGITQGAQRTTALSAGRDQKMQTLAECGYFVHFTFMAQAYHGKIQSFMERANIGRV